MKGRVDALDEGPETGFLDPGLTAVLRQPGDGLADQIAPAPGCVAVTTGSPTAKAAKDSVDGSTKAVASGVGTAGASSDS